MRLVWPSWRVLLAGSLVGLAIVLLAVANPFRSFEIAELKALDARFALRGPAAPASPIVVVTEPPAASLRATVDPISGTLFSGVPVSVRWTVSNQGPNATPVSSWVDSVSLSQNSSFAAPGRIPLLRVAHTGSLGLNDSYAVMASVTLPNGIEGQWFLFVQPDADSVVNHGTTITITLPLQPEDAHSRVPEESGLVR